MKAIKALKVDEKEHQFLTPDEGRTLIDAAQGQIRSFIITGLNTGMRKGELFRLEWQDVDLVRQELRVRMTKARRFRVIPMNDLLTQTLQRHPHHISKSYVFHNPNGSHWKDIRGSFNTALKRVGLPRIRIHDLRHTFISNLVMAGVDLRTVQELAGHANIQTTMKYAHLAPGRLKQSVEKLQWYSS